MARDSINKTTDFIIHRSLLTAGELTERMREQLVRRVVDARVKGLSTKKIIEIVRRELVEFESVLAQHMTDADIAGWLAGMDETADKFPKFLNEIIQAEPARTSLTTLRSALVKQEPVIRFPRLEKAAERLERRNILTRPQFDLLADEVKERTFTVAGDITTETIGRIRDVLLEDVREGTSLSGFQERVAGELERSFLSEAHLENVYRTNVQAAFRDGQEEIANNPIVASVFPFAEILPIDDPRVREDHLAVASLGLDGTGVYWAEDPFWDFHTPPWGYQCRCGKNVLRVKQAAAKGVKAAKEWLETGRQPTPEFRLDAVRSAGILPEPGFGGRGRAAA